MRVGLKRLLSVFNSCQLIDCDNVEQACKAVVSDDQSVDLLVFGMHVDELESLKQLVSIANAQGVRVLVISEMRESVYAPLCISAGARGFVSLSEQAEVVLAAIKAVLLGGIYVNRLLARHPIMQQIVDKGELKLFELFSLREREIAQYLIEDTSLHDVSDKLNLSYTTVATYRDRILKKANVTHISHLSKLIGHKHGS